MHLSKALSLSEISFATILALFVLFQFTVGARLAASDLVIALLIPLLVLSIRNIRLCPQVVALGACTLLLAIGVIRGPMDIWGMTKFGGWFVLLAYAGTGILLSKHYHLFARVYVFALCILILCFVGLTVAGIHWGGPRDPRFSGLMSNPNAFALALLCGVVMCQGAFSSWEPPAAILTAGILFTGSLAGFVALAAIVFLWLAWNRKLSSFVRVAGITIMVYFTPIILNYVLHELTPKVEKFIGVGLITKFSAIGSPQENTFVSPKGNLRIYQLPNRSFEMRAKSNEQAINLWKQSPVFGAGLGTFWEKYRDGGAIIHSTPIWLLTEMGVVGLAAFAFLAMSFGWFFWRCQCYSGLLVLVGWGMMSLPHEMMYQRIPWLVLGLLCGAGTQVASKRLRSPTRPSQSLAQSVFPDDAPAPTAASGL